MATKTKEVQEILEYLNSLDLPGKGSWTEAKGYHALSALEVKQNRLSIITESATPIKLFINTETGEIRTYWAYILDDDYEEVPAGKTSSGEAIPPSTKMGI